MPNKVQNGLVCKMCGDQIEHWHDHNTSSRSDLDHAIYKNVKWRLITLEEYFKNRSIR